MNHFAILDAGHPGVQRAPFHPSECIIPSWGLFAETPEAALVKRGPWLAPMETYGGFDYRTHVREEYAPHGAATWLSSPLSAKEVFDHLQRFMQVVTPRGRTALLRFWDGEVFQRLTYVLDREQFAGLVAPFVRWKTSTKPCVDLVWEGNAYIEKLSASPPLTLTDRQIGMLTLPQMRHVDRKLAYEILSGNPRAVAGREPLAVLAHVRRAYRYALEGLRLTDLRSVAAWVKADAGWAQGVQQHAGIELRTRTAKNADLCIEDMLSATKAVARHKEIV